MTAIGSFVVLKVFFERLAVDIPLVCGYNTLKSHRSALLHCDDGKSSRNTFVSESRRKVKGWHGAFGEEQPGAANRKAKAE